MPSYSHCLPETLMSNLRRPFPNGPVLNLDIISYIMKLLREETRTRVSPMMMACREFYEIGIPILLQEPLYLSDSKALKSFRDFMFATSPGPPNRFQLLRALHYSRWFSDPTDATLLCEVLARTTSLRNLSLSDTERFLRDCPDGFKTLMALSELREVELNDGEDKTLELLRTIKTPISKLTLSFWNRDKDTPDILPVITNLSGTLIFLELSNVYIGEVDSSIQFPHVRTLRIQNHAVAPAAIILRAFSNLKVLDVTMHGGDRDGDWEEDLPSDAEIRQDHETNKTAVDRLRLTRPPLLIVRGEPTDLYRSAFIWAVEKLEVLEVDCTNVEWLLALLPQLRPSTLDISINVRRTLFMTISYLRSILETASAAAELKTVILTIDIWKTPIPLMGEIVVSLSGRTFLPTNLT